MPSKIEQAEKLKEQYEAALNEAKDEMLNVIKAKKDELKALEANFEKLYGSAPKKRRGRRSKAEIEAAKAQVKAKKPAKPRAKKSAVKKADKA
jgi:hypothetical protein